MDGDCIAQTPGFRPLAAVEMNAERPDIRETHAHRVTVVAQGVVISAGRAYPLGCSLDGSGLNVAVFSRHATRIDLLLFEVFRNPESPFVSIKLDARCHRTGDIWHVRVEGAPEGIVYTLRANGPNEPARGHRFNPDKTLLDPYAIALVGTECWDFACAASGELDSAVKPKCWVAEQAPFDWQGDCPVGHPWSETIIYETHVRGLTIDPSSAACRPGTYLGVVEKIPHLQMLGVTAVELMPVQEFFENELTRRNPTTGERLRNYWGYSTVAFFAPKESYSTRARPGDQLTEFKTMVRELHRAGIEIILDIVFNHTAEGDHSGPTLNYRGLDNAIYYMLESDRRYYRNYSGCGNTLNCSHPVVRDHILDCLRYWVTDMHVDGFRFDLASVLGRDGSGELLSNPPLLERIAEDPILRHVKLVAEAWDAGGAYQVGSFPGQRWSEWNGRYRDDVRRFWRGDPGLAGAFASRLCGSADIYAHSGKQPVHSINFVTCHDGFTLNDLVSYNEKHNEANGEDNRDGTNENFSANYGTEGDTDDAAIEAVRVRQIKNFLATLFLSRGVPMLLGGDEFRRTQQGNNNAYCQDNAVSWYDWRLFDAHRQIVEFTAELIAFRKAHPVLRLPQFYTEKELLWFDAAGRTPNWETSMRGLGCAILAEGVPSLCLLFNPEDAPLAYQLPESLQTTTWTVAIDTAETPPALRQSSATTVCGPTLSALTSRSLRVLVARSERPQNTTAEHRLFR